MTGDAGETAHVTASQSGSDDGLDRRPIPEIGGGAPGDPRQAVPPVSSRIVLPAVVPPIPSRQDLAPTTSYRVVRGDSFARISKKMFGTEAYAKQIMELNDITNPLALRPDQTIQLPAKPAPSGGGTAGDPVATAAIG